MPNTPHMGIPGVARIVRQTSPMPDLVVPLDGRTALDPSAFGAKAAVLQQLVAAGLEVPAGFAVGWQAAPRVLDDPRTATTLELEAARAGVRAAPLAAGLRERVA